jgi:hypothetical protein
VQIQTVTDEIRSDIEVIERDSALYDEANFVGRAEALDFLEFQIIDRIAGLLQTAKEPPGLDGLMPRAEAASGRLEAVDQELFRRLRAAIRSGGCRGTALRELIDGYVGPGSRGSRRRDECGYDGRDAFINGLLLSGALPVETVAGEPEMVPYQQTPARIILQLAEEARLTRDDVFYDVGCGLGQVPILVHLLSGAAARGIDVEPAFCDYARARAEEPDHTGVEFLSADARTADYSEGTVFYLYTPFTGRMLDAVLARLHGTAAAGRVRLFTYGPCTEQVAGQAWLRRIGGGGGDPYRLAQFESTVP